METPPPLSPTRRRNDSSDSSPEFAFWNLGRHPSPPFLHSADQLFSGGFLLPLHLIPPPPPPPTPTPTPHPEPQPEPEPEPSPSMVTSSILTASKRWKEMIFKRVEKKHEHDHDEKSTDRIKREKRGLNNKSGELNININIWPFTRSRSAGNNTVRSRPVGRKVSSAPCSRSNSSGSRRSVPNSPGRTGVHLGRASPVWKIRRNRNGSGWEEGQRGNKQVGKGRVMNLSVPMCIGYRQQLSCRVDDNVAVAGGGGGGSGGAGGGGGGGGGGDSGGNGNLFSLRGLFSKKGVLTS